MDGPGDLAEQFRDHADRHRTLAELVPEILDRGVEHTVRAAFQDSQQYVPVDTGDLKQSGEVRHQSVGRWEIRYTEDYAIAVERGHDGYTVTPNGDGPLHFVVDGVDVFAMKADIPARDGVWYLRRAVEEHRDDHPRNIASEYRHALGSIF